MMAIVMMVAGFFSSGIMLDVTLPPNVGATTRRVSACVRLKLPPAAVHCR